MVNWFSNLWGGVKNAWGKVKGFAQGLPQKLVSGVNTVVNGVRNLSGKLGTGINSVTGLVKKGYDLVGQIPIVGSALQNSEYGQIVNKGIGIGQSAGDLANAVSSGDFGGMSNSAQRLITSSGGSVAGVKKSATDLLSSILG